MQFTWQMGAAVAALLLGIYLYQMGSKSHPGMTPKQHEDAYRYRLISYVLLAGAVGYLGYHLYMEFMPGAKRANMRHHRYGYMNGSENYYRPNMGPPRGRYVADKPLYQQQVGNPYARGSYTKDNAYSYRK